MNRAALGARHHAAVTRYARQLGDEGRVPPGLLDELARIADQHAADAAMAAVAAGPLGAQPEEVRIMHVPAPAEPPSARTATHSAAEPPDTESSPPAPPRPPAARTAPRKRTRTRTT